MTVSSVGERRCREYSIHPFSFRLVLVLALICLEQRPRLNLAGGGDMVTERRILPDALRAGPMSGAASAGPRPFEPLRQDRVTFPFVTQARRELAVTLTARAVFDLKRATVVGRRLDRAIRHCGGEPALAWAGGRALQTRDLKRLDLHTLRHGLNLLAGEGEGVGVVPVFWRTVANAGPVAFPYADPEAETKMGPVLFEVFGAEHAQPDAIRAATMHLEPHRRGVVVHVSPVVDQVRRLGAADPGGLAVDFAGVETASARAWEGAVELIVAARAAAPVVLLLNLSPDRGEAAAAAGGTHAVFAAMHPVRA